MNQVELQTQLTKIHSELSNLPTSGIAKKRTIKTNIDKLSELIQGLNEPLTDPVLPTNSFGLTEHEVFYLCQMWKSSCITKLPGERLLKHELIPYLYQESGVGMEPMDSLKSA
ncbi:MAG: hypothetical protein AAF208_06715 [Cyanobacteria bacterium P01_A01_bin.45]